MKKNIVMMIAFLAATMVFAEGKPQTTCPVMKGNKINSELHTDVNGYRIYVCCGGCIKAIKANPEKYIKQMTAKGVELEKVPKK